MAAQLLGVFRAVRQGRFLYLMVILLLYLLAFPFLQNFIRFRFLNALFVTAILVASIYAAGTGRVQTRLALGLAGPMLVLVWMAYHRQTPPLALGANAVTLVFIAVIMVALLRHIFRIRRVTRHMLYAAVCVYLLMGVFWSNVYLILEIISPGSFSQSPGSDTTGAAFFIYFSFVTLTTLGYGDISPVSSHAQAFAVVEAIVGQIYLTVLIAWLVGLYASRKFDEWAG